MSYNLRALFQGSCHYFQAERDRHFSFAELRYHQIYYPRVQDSPILPRLLHLVPHTRVLGEGRRTEKKVGYLKVVMIDPGLGGYGRSQDGQIDWVVD